MLKANGIDSIPVHAGPSYPIIIPHTFHRDYWYGNDGFSDVPDVYPPSTTIQYNETESHQAILAIGKLAQRYPGEIDLIGKRRNYPYLIKRKKLMYYFVDNVGTARNSHIIKFLTNSIF